MKTFIQNLLFVLAGGLAVGIGVSFANSPGQPAIVELSERIATNMFRPCIYPTSGWSTIDSDNSGANLSGQMETWSTYAIQCDADAYVSWGDSSVATDSSDGWLAAGAIVRFSTGGNDYVSVLNKSDATADCHYIQCM
jgi:hypothetical protein